ncbi:hypothetical protein RD110_12555 [Rhodoferax koreense]|uniref:Glycine zipper 2TM domain-containing protein n=2 Tax=Rhodoferax koreensis TaxID=1842727 RepID=A0A1P8K3T5_9BURK|nr:hypothetical protein RD110_12555 [Rhodoferax koreense]
MADRMQHSKMLVAIIAVLGVTVAALGAALVVKSSDAQPGPAMAPVAAVTAPAALSAPVAPLAPQAAPAVKAVTAPQPAPNYATQTVQPKAPVQVARNDVCVSCGTVESVTAVQRQGQVNGVNVGNTTVGIGTVAGGLLGGLLGNQVGGGTGRTAATVLGVAGGAYAGNAVEKNMKKVTVYDVRVRMDNGTYRHMDISTSVPVGSRVIVEGKNLRLANGNG